MPTIQFKALSEQALFVQFTQSINEEAQQHMHAAITALKQQPFPGLIEIVPSYTNFCIFYEPYTVLKQLPPAATISERVEQYVQKLLNTSHVPSTITRNIVEIPVIYGGQHGPDLQEVARVNRLTPDEVISLHTSRDYLVYMIGFAPGFPYLGGLPEQLFTARRSTPRLHIPAGSVGIGGEQTGIYPFDTPGGWHIIGRTLTPLFSLQQKPPTLIQAGDLVRFIAVEEDSPC